ncbi:MAG: DUF11 domain-containing protein [Cellvibrionaceae bacterium]|nr:DUF11 domain-containing protein [Cellvibrionaceae bacterium]
MLSTQTFTKPLMTCLAAACLAQAFIAPSAEAAITSVSRNISPAEVVPGDIVTVTYSINHDGALGNLAISDNYAATLSGATFTSLSALSCENFGSINNNSSSGNLDISWTAAAETSGNPGACQVSLALTVPNPSAVAPGTVLSFPSVDIDDGGASFATGSSNLRLANPPSVNANFNPAVVNEGDTAQLQFTLLAGASNGINVSGVGFSQALPAGLVLATPNNATSSCGGALAVADGGSNVALSGFTIGPNGTSCTIIVDVLGQPGIFSPTPGAVSSEAGAGVINVASDLQVAPLPVITMTSSPSNPNVGDQVTVSITIDNTAPAAIVRNNLGLQFDLPPELGPTTGAMGCPGSYGSGFDVDWSAGTVGAGASCTLSLTATVLSDGNIVINSSDLSGDGYTVSAASSSLSATVAATAVPTLGSLPLLALAGLLMLAGYRRRR